MRLPRVRLRTLMIAVAALALAFAAMPTAWLLFPSFRSRSGGGGKEVPLAFLVVDRLSGEPVEGADVVVSHPFRPDLIAPRRGVTGEDGRAVVPTAADSSGRTVTAEAEGLYRVTIWETERVSLSGGSAAIRARGYHPVRIDLPEAALGSTITIRLDPSVRRADRGPGG